jgi:oligoendopeptidase F
VWQRYFHVKGRALGTPLTRYDIYAPLDTVDRKTTFEEAVAMTLSAFTKFSPRMGHLAKEIYDRKHVDALPRPGKRGGAFCAGIVPGLPPYLLYNHTGRLRDAFTVAHETGHGVHSQIARDKSILSGGHALPIAETASVFGEMLLSESLLATADVETKKALIVQKLNDMYATVGRQSFFTLWEREAHRIVVAGGTIDDVSSAYMDSLREQFGDMEIPDAFKDEWVGIPHFFHSPFYCYAYSFGNLLTLALYATYREQGAAFVPKFEAFLAAGETADPVTLCKMVGVDIRDATFWKSGFKIIEEMLDELERLT